MGEQARELEVRWGLAGELLSLRVDKDVLTAEEVCATLKRLKGLGAAEDIGLYEARDCDLPFAAGRRLPGAAELRPATGATCTPPALQAVVHRAPQIYMAEATSTFALSHKFGWCGWIMGLGGQSIVDKRRTIPQFDEDLPADLRARAQELERLVSGLPLPGAEGPVRPRRTGSHSCVVLPGVEHCAGQAIARALGMCDDMRAEVCLERTDLGCLRGGGGRGALEEEAQRLARVADILESSGDTYKCSFTIEDVDAPVLYVAWGQDQTMLGVMAC